MAILKGTNPECDERSTDDVRWVVRRVRRGLLRRERIEVSVERNFAKLGGFAGWMVLDPDRAHPTPREQEVLLLTIADDRCREVIDAKIAYLLDMYLPSIALCVESLRDRLHTARSDVDRFGATIGEMERIHAALKRDHSLAIQGNIELSEVNRGLAAELSAVRATAARAVREGYAINSLRSEDGVMLNRGDNLFLGTDPDRRLVLIDMTEAMEPGRGRVVGLPDGVPVFSRRDLARDWRKAHQANPSKAPTAPHRSSCDAPASPAAARVSASGIGSPDAAAAGDRSELLPIFGGEVESHAC